MSIEIKYKDSTIANLKNGETATIPCSGKKLTGDLTIIAPDSSNGECSGDHIIEVAELPTENIDTTALYKCGESDSYHKYVDGVFTDIIMVDDGETSSLLELYSSLLGVTPELYQIKTKPTTEEELAEIVVTDFSAGVIALYYIEDEADVFAYNSDSGWEPLGATGIIGDVSEATAEGAYILGGPHWVEYIVPKGNITITENSTVDVTDKTTVIVDLPITPTTYIVENSAALPADAPVNSIAIVLRG